MTSMWMIIAAFMVFFMQAGFLMIEAGSVRAKNSLNVAQKNVSDMIICLLVYSLFGFGIMYGITVGGFFGTGGVKSALEDVGGWPTLLIFNLAFCSVVATIVSGAVAERMRIGAYFISTAAIALFVYPIFGHWVWGDTIIPSNLALLANMGFVDHAGGIAIHALGGFFALAAIMVLGARSGRFDEKGNVLPIDASNGVLALSGALILFVTWIPFNTGVLTPGSQLFADVALITVIGGAAGGLGGKTLGYIVDGKVFSPHSSFNGILGGLVAITCGAPFLGPVGAFVLGTIGGIAAIGGQYILLHKFKLDDPVGAVSVHGIAGVFGGVLFPFLSVKPLPAGSVFSQFSIQLLGAGACIIWAMLTGLILIKSMKKYGILRVSEAQEHLGLNFGEHAPNVSKSHLERAYTASQKAQKSSPLKALSPFKNSQGSSELGHALMGLAEENEQVSKQAETQLKIFTAATESLTDGMLIYAQDGKITNLNSAFKAIMTEAGVKCELGMSRRDFVIELIKADSWDLGDTPTEAWLEQYLEQQGFSQEHEENITLAGNRHFIRRSRPIDGGGQIVTLTDVSEINQTVIKAQAAEKSKSEFLANMSHEIRTPMNGIIGMTELLSMTEMTSRQKHFVDTISRSGSALMTIINDILDFSKIEAGQAKLDPAPFVLREAIEDVTTLLSSSAAEKGIDLLVRVQPELPSAYLGDVGRLRQILTNLVGNAVKFTHFGHVLVDVSGRISEGQAFLDIRVEDTGIGIPEDQIEHVFEKFKQVDGTTTREYEGTGLGLSISSNLIELMGGSIRVDSEAGTGTIFTVGLTLPTHEDLVPAKATPVEIIGANILVVDDNAVNRNILREQIKHWKCRSVAVESGAAALKVLENAKVKNVSIDLMIVDFHMPGMNGEDLFNTVRAQDHYKDMPVIMLTSVNEDAITQRLQKNGLNAVMTKPARTSTLLNAMTDCLFEAQSKADNPVIAVADISRPDAAPLTSAVENIPDTPRVPSAPIKSPTPTTSPAPVSISDSFDVIVAEDNETNQVYIKYVLEELGVSFKIVPNGRAAVDQWRTHNPAIILMDVSMPVMNGYQATEEIRRLETKHGRAHTPIVAVTAHTLSGDEDRCIEAGMDDYLSKPVSIAGLRHKLQHWKVLQDTNTEKEVG